MLASEPPNATSATVMLPSTTPRPPGVTGKLAASWPAPYASSRPFHGMGAWMARNIMAKQAQSASQFSVPQLTMRPICDQRSRTAVIQAMIDAICWAVSPRGRPVTATDTRSAVVTTAWSGRS